MGYNEACLADSPHPLCARCFFFQRLNDDLRPYDGRCRRYPPAPGVAGPDAWAITSEGGFCGEYLSRAERIAQMPPAERSLYGGVQ